MSRQKLQLLVAVCQEIPDRLNVRCCSTRAVSCLNFKKVPELCGFLGLMQWMWCTRNSSRWGFKGHQLYGTCAGPSHRVWAYPECLSGALSQACPFHSYPPISKASQNPEQICSRSKPLAAGLVQYHRSFCSHELFDHLLFSNEQGLGMKRSRTVPYAGIGIIGTKGCHVRALSAAPALLIS